MDNNSTLNPYDTCEQIFSNRNRPDQLNYYNLSRYQNTLSHQCFTQKYNHQEAIIWKSKYKGCTPQKYINL